MNLNEKYLEELEKIEKICESNELAFSFMPKTFPLIMSIEPYWQKGQQSLLEDVESNLDARVDFVFGDDLVMKIIGDFDIEEDVMNKIKNGAKKLHYIWLQMWYKEKDARFARMHGKKTIDDVKTIDDICNPGRKNPWGLILMHRDYRP